MTVFATRRDGVSHGHFACLSFHLYVNLHAISICALCIDVKEYNYAIREPVWPSGKALGW